MLLNYYAQMNRSKIHFDFVVNRDSIGCLEHQFSELGSKIFHIPALREDRTGHCSAIREIFKSSQYDGIHFHMGFYACFDILLAKRHLPQSVIYLHSHIAYEPLSPPMKIAKALLSRKAKRAADIWCACGIDAGIYLYGKRAVKSGEVGVIYNAIELKKFQFCENLRAHYRAEYHLSDKFVLGNVGRLTYQKNQVFLLRVFSRVHIILPHSVLILIGAGEDETLINKLIHESGLNDCVKVLGARTDADAFYNAFDLFVLPSRFEGLGITLVEAQANGLMSFASECVPREVKLTESIEFLPLQEDIWVEKILRFESLHLNRHNNYDKMKESRYDILRESPNLERLYLDSIGRSEA